MYAILLATSILTAAPDGAADGSHASNNGDSAAIQATLREFRNQFIKLTPGQDGFPSKYRFGQADRSRIVTINNKLEIDRYEVTQQLWQAVMGTNPSRWKGPRNSVEMISFDQANQFCQRVTQLMRRFNLIEDDQRVTLPTEIQWEYAARAGTDTAYSFGDDANQLDHYAWYTGNAAGNDPPVGAKLPNPWGLYDVHGYLWEWCRGETEQAPTVLRGGSWKSTAIDCRSAARRPAARALRDDAVGFRCVIVPTASR